MSRKKIEANISYDDVRQRYYVYMDMGKDALGRRIRQYRTCDTLSAARRCLLTFQVEQEVGAPIKPKDTTLRQWLDYWMREIVIPSRAQTTVYGYQKIIDNHLEPALGDILLHNLTPVRLQDYYSALMREKGLSANTVRRHHDLLSAALHSAQRMDMLTRCPTDRVEPPRSVPYEASFYRPEELKTLYALVEGHPLELVVKLTGSLGLRREELCGLRWESVDFRLRRISIREARTAAGAMVIKKETKNRSSCRVMYMDDSLLLLLRREWQRQKDLQASMGASWPGEGMVVLNRANRPYSPNALSLAFTRFITRHGLPRLTLHGLRHTFATVAAAQGAPLFEIGKALGHSTPATTGKIYTHLIDQTHQATLARVASALR